MYSNIDFVIDFSFYYPIAVVLLFIAISLTFSQIYYNIFCYSF